MAAPAASVASLEGDSADVPPAHEEQRTATSSTEKHETGTMPETQEHDEQDTANRKEEEGSSQREDAENADEADEAEEREETSAPPLPDEVPPPLPDAAPLAQTEDDGWEPVWDASAHAYYFFNRFTRVSQWENPRVPAPAAPGTQTSSAPVEPPRKKSPVLGGYNPAIHGDYDPTASYAQQYEEQPEDAHTAAIDPTAAYAASGTFNRFTGRWQAESINPENYNDENKARRQMNAFFDVDAAANSHDGRSLRAERSAKKLSKQELKMFKEKRREKKEEKRRAWLRD